MVHADSRLRPGILILLAAVAGCQHGPSAATEIPPSASCAGQLVLEFTNKRVEPVQVGWIPDSQLVSQPAAIAPIWLGTVGQFTARFPVPGPGHVIFRTANPAGLREEHHEVSHRLLCERTPQR